MLGKYTQEIAIGNMDWEKANALTKILIEEGYAVLTTLEEQLIIINYTYANNYPSMAPNRNNVMFMSLDDYDIMEEEKMKALSED